MYGYPRQPEESIYNLLPQPEVRYEKPKMHRSTHDGRLAPSYSTLCTQNTTKLEANCEGRDRIGASGVKKASTMGRLGDYPDASKYLKRGDRSSRRLPPIASAHHERPDPKNPPVPRRTERPVMGLVTEKNFVIANAVDNIMMQPKKPADHPAAATQRRTFGKPPGYLTRIKEEIEHEREYIRQLQHPPRGEGRMREMPPDEKQELLARLKEKWVDTHKQYLSQTFSLDTVSKVHRKEAIEAQLEQLEKAIAKLSKKILYVYDDNMY